MPRFFGDSCRDCGFGHYCPEGTASMEDVQGCPEGYHRNARGGVSVDDCEICPPGKFTTKSGARFCEPCPSSTFCPLPGTTNEAPLMCPDNNYCWFGASEPTACPPGTGYSREANNWDNAEFVEDCVPMPEAEGMCAPGTL